MTPVTVTVEDRCGMIRTVVIQSQKIRIVVIKITLTRIAFGGVYYA
jgi:hypothetical protein